MAIVGFLVAMRVAIPGLIGSILAAVLQLDQDNEHDRLRQERYEIAGHYFLLHPWFGRGFNTLYPATQQVFDNAYLYVATETGCGRRRPSSLLFFLIIIFIGPRHPAAGADPETRGLAQALDRHASRPWR